MHRRKVVLVSMPTHFTPPQPLSLYLYGTNMRRWSNAGLLLGQRRRRLLDMSSLMRCRWP